MDIKRVITEKQIEIIDVRYTPLDGRMRSISFPVERLDSFIKKGIGVDGSSLGLKDEANSDMLLKPDTGHYYLDPLAEIPSLIFFGELFTQKKGEHINIDSRWILKKTLSLIKEEGIADEILILPELEFYIFDQCFYYMENLCSIIDITPSDVSRFNGYHMDYPQDSCKDFRSHLMKIFHSAGIEVKYGHHEVGRFGQHELELSSTDPITAADNVLFGKYLTHRLSGSYDFKVTFMPKPIDGEPGSGLHFHILLKLKGDSIFYDESNEKHLSEQLRAFSIGILKHGRALSAFTNPSTNSYKRLASGFEAPWKLFYSVGSRKSAIRVPDYYGGKDIDIEYRPPDATCNPYLALSAILLAGLEGIKKSLGHKDVKGKEPEELPSNLLEALLSLELDCGFLLENGIFSESIIGEYIEMKKKEFWEIENKPTPLEFIRYFSV